MMAVSATASAATVFVVVIAFAVATTIATTVTSASTTLVTHAGEQILYLFGCSIAVLEYGALELQSLACQGMVGIEGHAVSLNAGVNEVTYKRLASMNMALTDIVFIGTPAAAAQA